MPRHLSAIIIDRNMMSRSRLREALKNVADRSEVEYATNSDGVLDKWQSGAKYEILFVASTCGIEMIAKLCTDFTHIPGTSKPLIIVNLRPQHQENDFVASLYLAGVHGFICEPFSVDGLQNLLNTAKEAREIKSSTDSKLGAAAGFLMGGAIEQLDNVAEIKIKDHRAGGYALKNLKRLSNSLRTLYEQVPDKFEKIMLARFEKIEPPKRKNKSNKKEKKKLEVAAHPGKVIAGLMQERSLTLERIATNMKISEDQLQEILAGTVDLNEQTAKEIARCIGRTDQYWLDMQKKFDLHRKESSSLK